MSVHRYVGEARSSPSNDQSYRTAAAVAVAGAALTAATGFFWSLTAAILVMTAAASATFIAIARQRNAQECARSNSRPADVAYGMPLVFALVGGLGAIFALLFGSYFAILATTLTAVAGALISYSLAAAGAPPAPHLKPLVNAGTRTSGVPLVVAMLRHPMLWQNPRRHRADEKPLDLALSSHPSRGKARWALSAAAIFFACGALAFVNERFGNLDFEVQVTGQSLEASPAKGDPPIGVVAFVDEAGRTYKIRDDALFAAILETNPETSNVRIATARVGGDATRVTIDGREYGVAGTIWVSESGILLIFSAGFLMCAQLLRSEEKARQRHLVAGTGNMTRPIEMK